MILIALLVFAAAALASAAGFFSIYGLVQIFSTTAISVIVMGSSMELAKLVTASFLYRHWTRINAVLKVYLCAAVLLLMTITSIGVFGYLTAAYQRDSTPLTNINQTLVSDKAELQRLITRKNQIDTQVAQLPSNSVNARKALIKTFSTEYNGLGPKIDALTTKVNSSQTQQLDVSEKVGPIMYVAKVLGQDPDKTVFYLTIIIVIVFDPLAVALTLSANMAIKHRAEEEALKALELEPTIEVTPTPEPTPEPTPSPSPTPSSTPEPSEERAKLHSFVPTPTPTPTPEEKVVQTLSKRDQIVNDLYAGIKNEVNLG